MNSILLVTALILVSVNNGISQSSPASEQERIFSELMSRTDETIATLQNHVSEIQSMLQKDLAEKGMPVDAQSTYDSALEIYTTFMNFNEKYMNQLEANKLEYSESGRENFVFDLSQEKGLSKYFTSSDAFFKARMRTISEITRKK